MTTVPRRASGSAVVVTEKTYACSDGVQLAVRHWTNGVVGDDDRRTSSSPPSSSTRKILCLHGWLDNAASFDRLAPLLLDPPSSTPPPPPTEIVALDFPGHGLSAHKSVDGPPQLLAEYAYYVAELVEALRWGARANDAAGAGAGRTVAGNIESNTANGEGGGADGEMGNDRENKHDKISLVGHSMGSGVATVLCAAFPEWFSALILLEGGLLARNADDAAKHVRAAVRRRLKSNRTLFPDAGNVNVNDRGTTPRAKVYGSLDAAVEARMSTAQLMPGDQSLSYEAARDMVLRATSPAASAPPGGDGGESGGRGGGVVFRHDPRLQWPSLQYYTREQAEAFFRDVNASAVPVCFLRAADGWPVDAWAESMVREVLRPGRLVRLSGSHHFHADPDSAGAVAEEIAEFLEENGL